MEKQLFRIKSKDTKLAGVCLGLAEYFALDVTLVRVVFVVASIVLHAPLFLIYGILWIILPLKTEISNDILTDNINNSNSNLSTMSNQSNQNSSVTGGVILIILGSIFAIREFFDVNIFHFIGKLWPLFLVGLGVWLIIRERPIKPNNNSDTNL